MSCDGCEERRRLMMDAYLNAKIAQAVGHSVLGVAEMVGVKKKMKGRMIEMTKTPTFETDEDALDLLHSYGHREVENGVIRGEWESLNADCAAAVKYLCDEWDFVFLQTSKNQR